MLRCFDNCNEVKVGITELQERVEVPAQIGISIQKVVQQAMNEDGPKYSGRKKKNCVLPAGPDGRLSGKA